MPCPSRVVSLANVLLLTAGFATAFSEAYGQSRPGRRDPDQRDTMPVTWVVFVPATEKYDASRITRALKGRQVAAIYTTDGPVARRFADRLHTDLGAPLILKERAGKGAAEFAGALAATIADSAARAHLNRALLVVGESDLVRPFIERGAGARAAEVVGDDAGTDSIFVIVVRADNTRLIMRFLK